MATGHILGVFFLLIILIKSESHSVVSDSLWPHVLYSPWNSPGQNTGMCSLSLLQGIFPTQESNPGLPHCRWILYQRTQKGSPGILERLINLKWGRAGTACSGSVTCWVLAIWAQEDSMSAWSWQANIEAGGLVSVATDEQTHQIDDMCIHWGVWINQDITSEADTSIGCFAHWTPEQWTLETRYSYYEVQSWTVACQAPLSMEFSRLESWSQ